MATYGYARVSTQAQAADGESLEVQQRKIEGRALQDGARLDRVFVERGVSGSKPLEDRPQGKALLDCLRAGDTIIASKLDRLFRSASDALRVLDDIKRRRVSLVLLDMGGDVTGNGVSALVFTILSAVAEFARGRIAERITEVKRDMKRRGLHPGGSRPFGFRVGEAGRLDPVDAEQAAIRLMAREHRRGRSLRAIAATVRQRTGLAVSHVTVRRVLSEKA